MLVFVKCKFETRLTNCNDFFRKKNEEDRLRFAPKKKRGPRRISDKDLYKITVLLPRVMFEQVI